MHTGFSLSLLLGFLVLAAGMFFADYRRKGILMKGRRSKPTLCVPNRNAMLGTCHECKQPLVEIEDRGRHLTGCLTCNIWWSADDKKVRSLGAGFAGATRYAARVNRRARKSGAPEWATAPGL